MPERVAGCSGVAAQLQGLSSVQLTTIELEEAIGVSSCMVLGAYWRQAWWDNMSDVWLIASVMHHAAVLIDTRHGGATCVMCGYLHQPDAVTRVKQASCIGCMMPVSTLSQQSMASVQNAWQGLTGIHSVCPPVGPTTGCATVPQGV